MAPGAAGLAGAKPEQPGMQNMKVQDMPACALLKIRAPMSAEEYLAMVEEFDALWSARKSAAGQARMDELMIAMRAYEESGLRCN